MGIIISLKRDFRIEKKDCSMKFFYLQAFVTTQLQHEDWGSGGTSVTTKDLPEEITRRFAQPEAEGGGAQTSFLTVL